MVCRHLTWGKQAEAGRGILLEGFSEGSLSLIKDSILKWTSFQINAFFTLGKFLIEYKEFFYRQITFSKDLDWKRPLMIEDFKCLRLNYCMTDLEGSKSERPKLLLPLQLQLELTHKLAAEGWSLD